MLSQAERELVVRSWRLVLPILDTAADLFYRRLFEIRPELRALFAEDLSEQKKKLGQMLSFVVRSADFPALAWSDDTAPEADPFLVLAALGHRHAARYRVADEAYETVGEALLWTLERGLGDAFDAAVRGAWTKLYGAVARVMKMGARRDAPDRVPGLDGDSVAAVLEAAALTRRLACIEVAAAPGAIGGAIWVKSGQLVAATAGERTGIDALRTLLAQRAPCAVRHPCEALDAGVTPLMSIADAIA